MFGRVEQVEHLSPHMIRVVLGGDGLAEFTPSPWTDSYVNAYFLPPGATYTVPFDVDAVRALPVAQRPHSRRYTVRHWDPERRQLSIDFVVHGDTGVAGPWASAARPGDVLQINRPAGSYAPDPDADWHLMIGDESALPAIAASLTHVPTGKPVYVVAEVDGPADELSLVSPGDLHVSWLHRDANPGTDDLALQALDKLDRLPGRVQAFVHGEAVVNRALRKHLLVDWKLPREALSVSPYWRRTFTDESWRTIKRDWLHEVEQDA
jgi:NADPH-dependent ferric siderophore reductase